MQDQSCKCQWELKLFMSWSPGTSISLIPVPLILSPWSFVASYTVVHHCRVSGGRGTRILLCLFSSTCWIILLKEKSFSMCLFFKRDEFFIVKSLPSSTWPGDVGFQVGAVGDGNEDFSRKVSVLSSISTEQLLFCHLDYLRQPAEVADFFTLRAAGVGPYLWLCSNSGALLVLNTSSLSHNRRLFFFLTKAHFKKKENF